MKTDEIRRELVIDAPIEKVWDALTDPGQLSQWFGDIAEVDLRPGGRARFGWSEYESVSEAVVETVERPLRFSFRWEAVEGMSLEEASTLVQFDLEPAGGKTRLRMVESGFASLPEDMYERRFSENDSGWTAELADLTDFLMEVRTIG